MKGVLKRAAVVGGMAIILCAASHGCKSARAGLAAGPWTLTDIEGTEHSLADQAGQVVVLAFWSSDDVPSRLAATDIQKVYARFADRAVAVFGISMEIMEGFDAYFDVEQHTFTQLIDDGSAAKTYAVDEIPTFVVIGLDNGVVFREEGFTPGVGERLALAIQQQLRQHGM